jgi:hypothetical protein
MLLKRNRYLDILCGSKTVSAKDLANFRTDLPSYTTANPVHAREICSAVYQLQQHFSRKNPPRPLNAIILGGPGSGKTYLANQLKQAVNAEYEEYNLSQFQHPSEIRQCFVKAARWLESNPQRNLLIFFDEFDVRISGMSAIQYLIQPIYDGKTTVDNEEVEFKRAAFLFSGSYLKERRVFDRIAGGEQLDLARILFDTYHLTFRNAYPSSYQENAWKELMAVTAYDPVRQQLSSDRDVIAYVRSLDKIIDFVSRINGFVLELRNLNSPLHATRDGYRIELECDDKKALGDSAEVVPDEQVAAQLFALIDGLRQGDLSDRFYDYTDARQPVLEYKNLLLIDRLARVADLLKRTYRTRQVRIFRGVLNYLVTAPLVHGMRSLSTLIESLIDDRGVLDLPADMGVIERNISRYSEYQNAHAVWARVRRHNPVFAMNPLMDKNGTEAVTII